MKKRFLAVLVALTVALALLPGSAFAEDFVTIDVTRYGGWYTDASGGPMM